jgi:hypothetical protein
LITSIHVKRWIAKEFISSHNQTPGEWSNIWSKTRSTNPNDYSLVLRDGIYTNEARKTFIAISQIQDHPDIWSDEELEKVGELDGVCAFLSPQAALKYGRESGAGKYNKDLYVEFLGIELCPAPEDNGIVATVVEPIFGPADANTFATRHNIKL